MTKIEEKVLAAIEPKLNELGYELVEVKFVPHPDWTLTVFIDSAAGVGLDDCERVSKEIDPILDELDPIDVAYSLNVSSPGLDRPIKSDRDFERNRGREVEAKLFAPLPGTKIKKVEGVLEGKTGDSVTIRRFDGSPIEIKSERIALLTQLIKFE